MIIGIRSPPVRGVKSLRGLRARGLRDPVLVVSDGAPGMIRAIDEVFSGSLRQRCLVHKKSNVLAKVPESERAEVGSFLSAVYYAPTPEVARTVAEQFAAK